MSLAVRACDLKWTYSPGVLTALAWDLGGELGYPFLGKPLRLILVFCLSPLSSGIKHAFTARPAR